MNTQTKKTLHRLSDCLRLHPSWWTSGVVKYSHHPRFLLLDFDKNPPSTLLLHKKLRQLKLRARATLYETSNTSGHWHVIIELTKPLPILAIFFCQLYLGSDRHRERWNFIRAQHYGRKDPYVQVLFSRKIN